MPCFKPLAAHRKAEGSVAVTRAVGKAGLEFGEFAVPCGRCIGCRLDKSRQWAVRCIHEERMNVERGFKGSFLTLTYDERNLPEDGSLDPGDHTWFIKRLRERLWRKHRRKIRFYMCGEYGEKLQRPHYHYLLFGYDFPDKYHWKTHRDQKYYRSEELEKLWPLGQSLIGDVTVESAGYCARYVMKKQTGPSAQSFYRNENGVCIEPEFSRMSLKPGIGAEWFAKYGVSDVYDSGDSININGKKYSTPRYYDKLLESLDVERLLEIKSERTARAEARASDNTYERLQVREEVQTLKAKRLERGYENGE